MRFATHAPSKVWRNGNRKFVKRQRCLEQALHAASSQARNSSNVSKNTNNDDPCWPRSHGATEKTAWGRSEHCATQQLHTEWIAATLTNEFMDFMAAKVWAGKRIGLRGAAKCLKWLVEGANTHLSAVLPCRMLGIVMKLVRQDKVSWRAPPPTVVSILRKTLKRLRWTDTSPFCWTQHTAEEFDVGVLLEKESLRARAAHQIRESFREKSMGPHLQHDQVP